MKAISYVSCFRKLKLPERITGHVELIPGVNISNDRAVKDRFLTPELANAVGVIEATHLRGTSNMVFGEFDEHDMRGLPPDRFLLVILLGIDMLLKNAWLIKDHAMECDACFLRMEVPGGTSWTKNFLAIRPSFAAFYDGERIRPLRKSNAICGSGPAGAGSRFQGCKLLQRF